MNEPVLPWKEQHVRPRPNVDEVRRMLGRLRASATFHEHSLGEWSVRDPGISKIVMADSTDQRSDA